MQNVIYADELILFNTLMTFILLLTVRQITGMKPTGGRLALASVAGGVYSMILLAPKMNVFLTLLTKMLMGFTITWIAFPSRVVRKTLKCALVFLGVSFCFGGVCYAAKSMLGGRFLLFNNGFFYYDLGTFSIIMISVGLYLTIKLLRKTLFTRSSRDMVYEMELTYNGKSARMKALFDSGHKIEDVYKHRPVILIAPGVAYRLTGLHGAEEILRSMEKGTTQTHFLLLPVSSLAATRLLPAFTASNATIYLNEGKKTLDSPCVAVTDDELGAQTYQALIGETALR